MEEKIELLSTQLISGYSCWTLATYHGCNGLINHDTFHCVYIVTGQYNLCLLLWLWNVIFFFFLELQCTLNTIGNEDSEMNCKHGTISQRGGAWKCVTLFCFSSSSEFKIPQALLREDPPHLDEVPFSLVTCLQVSRDHEMREHSNSILVLVWAFKYK